MYTMISGMKMVLEESTVQRSVNEVIQHAVP